VKTHVRISLILGIFLLLFPFVSFSQQAKIDSLLNAAEDAETDSAIANIYRKLFNTYVVSDMDSAEIFLALEMEYATKAGNTTMIADANEDYARIAWQRNKMPEALGYLQTTLSLREKVGDNKSIANCENNIGIIYWNMKNTDEALKHYRKSMAMRIKLNDSAGIAASYGNMGLVYREIGKMDSADLYYRRSTVIREILGDPRMLAIAYSNLAILYLKSDPDSAIIYIEKSLAQHKVTNDQFGIAGSLNNLGVAYRNKGMLDKAEEIQKESARLCIELDNKDVMKNAFGELATIYAEKGNYAEAYRYFNMKDSVKDLVYNENISQQVTEAGAKYESEKKQRNIDQLNASAEQDALLKKFLIALVALGVIVAISLTYAYFNKRKSNHQLALQNAQIESQKKEITDSINYAQRIQQAILPPESALKKHFPDGFVFYLPKAIVSGDFWWLLEKDNYVFVGIADCTGHGVPGAFMSMLGMEMLNDIARETSDPSEILAQLSLAIKRSLRQTSGETQSRDGMDIALMRFNLKSNELVYAGANRPLWVRKANGDVQEFSPTKAPIGGPAEENQQYESHKILLGTGDTLYAFTDGYADQFGGAKGKKLKTSGMRVLLEQFAMLPLVLQEQELAAHFHRWRGSLEQVDDVLVCGIRI
jgi:tetratricopeptide (TPR) repeat protein